MGWRACGAFPEKAVDLQDRRIVMSDPEEPSTSIERAEIASQGGKARALALSKERRREIGKAAAAKRWSTDLPRAESDGDLTIAGRRISCAVLSTKMRVLT